MGDSMAVAPRHELDRRLKFQRHGAVFATGAGPPVPCGAPHASASTRKSKLQKVAHRRPHTGELRACRNASKILALAISLPAALVDMHPARAQFARAYSNLPANTSIVGLTYSNTNSDWYTDDDIPTGLKDRINAALFSYNNCFTGFTGNIACLGFTLPYSSIYGYNKTLEQVAHDENGVGDPSITIDYNLFGAKAMSIEEFARTPDRTFGGFHFAFTLPLGSYDSDRANNIGSNRYALRTTFNLAIPWNDGSTWFEINPYVRVFGDNDRYLGKNKLGQDPIWGFNTFFSQNLLPKLYLYAGAVLTAGGQADVNGVAAGAVQANWQGVVGFGVKTWKGGLIACTYSETIYRSSGNPNSRSFLLLVQHAF
jgi:hypothetical protein